MSELSESLPLPRSSEWTWEEKQNVVQNWMVFGNVRTVSAVCKVPYETVIKWKATNWWKDYEEELKNAKSVQLNHKLETIVSRSLELVADRLEHGNIVVDRKTGETHRTPVSIREGISAANELLHKKILLDKVEKHEEHKEATVKETLAMLANEFAKMAKKEQKASAETIEYKEIE